MKKYIAILLCFAMLLSFCSCVGNNGAASTSASEENTEASQMTENIVTEDPSDEPAEKAPVVYNEEVRDMYMKAARNEIKISYSLHEMYLGDLARSQGTPRQQAYVDLDKDGTEELVLKYGYEAFIILRYYDGNVYAKDYFGYTSEIYDDGSFSWSNYDDIFGNEYGYSQILFINGSWKIEDLCRVENYSKYFIGGVQVTQEEYNECLDNYKRSHIEFTPFDRNMLTANEQKAVEIAESYWRDKYNDFDKQSGYRYRVVCNGLSNDVTDKWYRVSLYRFIYTGYQYLEIATVNIETGEIIVSEYPDGKG